MAMPLRQVLTRCRIPCGTPAYHNFEGETTKSVEGGLKFSKRVVRIPKILSICQIKIRKARRSIYTKKKSSKDEPQVRKSDCCVLNLKELVTNLSTPVMQHIATSKRHTDYRKNLCAGAIFACDGHSCLRVLKKSSQPTPSTFLEAVFHFWLCSYILVKRCN